MEVLTDNNVDVVTVLIIDDEHDFTDYLTSTLNRRDKYSVIAANNGKEGLLLAKENKPAVILLDIMMPGIDGFEVLRNLKSFQETMSIPVIMLSALSNHEARLQSLKLYSEGFIEKPCSVEDIISTIDDTLKRREELKKRIHEE